MFSDKGPMEAAPPTPPGFPDLNRLPPKLELKVEPKQEPFDDDDLMIIPPPIAPSNAIQLHPSSSSEEETSLFHEYYRLAQLFLTSLPDKSLQQPEPILVAPPPECPAPAIRAANPVRKQPPRSAEMVRVSWMSPGDHVHFRSLIRRARITYESVRLRLQREETARTPGHRTRLDMTAAKLMGVRGLWLNRDRRIVGNLPGIHIGDVFFFRMELCVLGLHGQVQAGIDLVPASRSATHEPVATSIIVSGGYEDDDDGGDILIYTGHGGRGKNLHTMVENQKLEGGNLALERSMRYGVEIRVIRGVKCENSPSNRIYVYDGLYKITDCWVDAGKSGFSVYKYKMIRIEGQEVMGSVILKFAQSLKANPLSVRPTGYISLDMSMGRENVPITVFNDMDDDRDPLFFEYIQRPIYHQGIFLGKGCNGEGGCNCFTNCSLDCPCARRNGGELPYDENGILLRGRPLIYECGPSCCCPPSCINRVSQKGLKKQLEVFRSQETGWGVRTLELIRAGSFVCELSGIVLTKEHADAAAMNGSSLVHPGRLPFRSMEWGDSSDVFPENIPPQYPPLPELSFSLDVSKTRNVACYLSHSFTPNVFVQFVLFDHYNLSYPHLMIFAMENIPPLRELSIDYGIGEEWVGRITM